MQLKLISTSNASSISSTNLSKKKRLSQFCIGRGCESELLSKQSSALQAVAAEMVLVDVDINNLRMSCDFVRIAIVLTIKFVWLVPPIEFEGWQIVILPCQKYFLLIAVNMTKIFRYTSASFAKRPISMLHSQNVCLRVVILCKTCKKYMPAIADQVSSRSAGIQSVFMFIS